MDRHTYLSLLVVAQPDRVEVLNDLFRCVVLLDLSFEVEAHHVTRVNLRRQLEVLLQPLLLRFLELLGTHRDYEVHVPVVVVFFVVLSLASAYSSKVNQMMANLDCAITLFAAHSLKLGLERLRPLVDRQLSNLNGRVVQFLDNASTFELVVRGLFDRAIEASPPGKHWDLLLAFHDAS